MSGSGGIEPAAAQTPKPHFELVPGADSEAAWRLYVDVPDGWALYAPATGALGLPISARWVPSEGSRAGGERAVDRATDRRPIRLDGPPGRLESSAAGPVAVYRGEVTLVLDGPGPTRGRDLEVTWALCRKEMCVPGRTRVPQKTR